MSNQKNVAWFKVIEEAPEARFDSRLIEKKLDEGFVSADESQQFIKSLPEETEYAFSSAEELDAQTQ
jgi:hypothetical protein